MTHEFLPPKFIPHTRRPMPSAFHEVTQDAFSLFTHGIRLEIAVGGVPDNWNILIADEQLQEIVGNDDGTIYTAAIPLASFSQDHLGFQQVYNAVARNILRRHTNHTSYEMVDEMVRTLRGSTENWQSRVPLEVKKNGELKVAFQPIPGSELPY